jgi:hypothetical protein
MTSTMNEGYWPKSDFLCMVANEEVSLTGSDTADHNLRLLIGFTGDPKLSNRDWATMLLAQQEIDTTEVRQALLAAANDSDGDVRAEALQGLAERDWEVAKPLVERELTKDDCGYGTFEAARLIAHPSLLDGLRRWTGRFTESWWNDLVEEAIAACEASLTTGT